MISDTLSGQGGTGTMPRSGRLHIPGGHYHIIGQGFEQRYILNQPTDLERLSNLVLALMEKLESNSLNIEKLER